MEHYKNKVSAYMLCRKAAQRTGIIVVVCHYTYWQVSQQSRKRCVAKLIRELVYIGGTFSTQNLDTKKAPNLSARGMWLSVY